MVTKIFKQPQNACHIAIQWQSLLTWLTASDEILELAFDTHIISSEYGLKHNLRQIKKFVCLRLAYCLCIEYEL